MDVAAGIIIVRVDRMVILSFFHGEGKYFILKNLFFQFLEKETIEARTFRMVSLDPELL